MLRGDVFRDEDAISDKWKTSLPKISPDEQHRWEEVRAQYARNTAYRRAFICNPCYTRLDNEFGVAEIFTPTGPKEFGLAGESRGGEAAVYTVDKWEKYQQRLYNRIVSS